MRRQQSSFPHVSNQLRFVGHLLLVMLMACSPGCVGAIANLVNVARGNNVPANFTGLKEKRVAVVCVSNSEAFGPAGASASLARQVSKLIGANVEKVTMIEQQKIEQWIDRNDWDYQDFLAVGRGVNADMVVAIDLDGFSLYDGPTLYKGRADVSMVVYDMTAGGHEVFAYSPNQIQHPENSSQHTTDTSERAFRSQFLFVLANRIARQFYPYDVAEDFARDASVIHAS